MTILGFLQSLDFSLEKLFKDARFLFVHPFLGFLLLYYTLHFIYISVEQYLENSV